MIVVMMLVYYVVAIGLLALVGYAAGRRNVSEIRSVADAAFARAKSYRAAHELEKK